MARLFGFSVEDNEKKSQSIVSPVPENNQDGSDFYIQSGFYGSYVDIEGVYRNEFDLIKSCLLYTSPSPRDGLLSRMPSSA